MYSEQNRLHFTNTYKTEGHMLVKISWLIFTLTTLVFFFFLSKVIEVTKIAFFKLK